MRVRASDVILLTNTAGTLRVPLGERIIYQGFRQHGPAPLPPSTRGRRSLPLLGSARSHRPMGAEIAAYFYAATRDYVDVRTHPSTGAISVPA